MVNCIGLLSDSFFYKKVIFLGDRYPEKFL